MNTVYILGGPPRTAKTTIMTSLAIEKNVPFIAADAVEHGLRNVLTGEPHQMLRNIEISGSAEHKTSFTQGGERKSFTAKGSESELTLQTISGMLDYYRRNQESVAFEGAAFTPDWVAGLGWPGITVKAAFVGFTDSAHADSVIRYAKDIPHDWINEWLQKDQGDETNVREWVQRQVEECIALRSKAELQGYPFFDISKQPFSEYKSSVLRYLLQS